MVWCGVDFFGEANYSRDFSKLIPESLTSEGQIPRPEILRGMSGRGRGISGASLHLWYFHRFHFVNEKVVAHASIKKWPSEVVGILLRTFCYLRARTGDVPGDRGLKILNITNIAKMDTKTQLKILNPKLLQHKCKIADHNLKQKLKEKRI